MNIKMLNPYFIDFNFIWLFKTIKEHMAGGLTYKKGKTVTVTHKTSGKELVIIDKPNVRKEYEKIGYVAEGKLNEVRYQEISISLDDFYKVKKLLKPKTKQFVKHPYSQKTFGLKVDKKDYDKTLEILMKKRIDIQG